MKLKKRILSALMACTIPLTLLCGGVSASSEKLVDLDMSGFTSAGTDESSCGIVNSGTSTTAQFLAFNSSITVTADTLTGVDGTETTYLKSTHPYYNWLKCGGGFRIADTAWEEEDVTFSFWIDLGTDGEVSSYPARCVADYCVVYNDGTSDTTKSTSIYQIDYDDGESIYRWNFPGYNTTAMFDMAESRGWTHVVMTNPQPNISGSKLMDVYINGVKKQTATVAVPDGSDVKSATLYFGKMNDNSGSAADAKIGSVQVYSGILTDDEIMNLYGETRGLYGFESPNSITDTPSSVRPDTESIAVTLKNEIDQKELGTVTLKRKSDGAVIPADVTVTGNEVTVTPKEYLSFSTGYIVDFPAAYCGDFEFTTEKSGVSVGGMPSVYNDRLAIDILSDGSSKSITMIAVGYNTKGKLMDAVSADITLNGDSVSTGLTKEGMSKWATVKLMVWENCEGYKLPLIETIELQ